MTPATEQSAAPWRASVMSVVGPEAENICSQRVFRLLTHTGSAPLLRDWRPIGPLAPTAKVALPIAVQFSREFARPKRPLE